MVQKNMKSSKGFSLIEVLIAATLILVLAVAFVPLFVYVAEASQANKARLVATKLASNEIEFIRSLSYPDIGTIDGNPEGVVERQKQTTVNNITYTVITDIWWVDDLSDNVNGNDPIPYDYKRVRVSVSSPSVFSAEITQTLDINTLTSLEGGEEAFPGGNIRANVIRGWNTYSETIPVSNAGISLSSGPDAPQSLATDEFGATLFAIIAEGEYIVDVNPTPLGMMAKELDFDISVVDGITTEVIFELEYPCYLEIELLDSITGNRVNAEGSVLLKDPVFGDRLEEFTSSDQGYLDLNFFGELWPIGEGSVGTPYGIEVFANGYSSYLMENDSWDGQFSSPGETKVIQFELDPINATIIVLSSVDNSPVVEASVTIYKWVNTYSGDQWLGELMPVESNSTGATGTVSLSLGNNTLEPLEPEAGDIHSPYYCVEVEADGFTSTGLIENAFKIEDSTMIINDLNVEAFEVFLESTLITGSIRVRAEHTNGIPREGVPIRVFDSEDNFEIKHTGSGGEPGIAVFEDLTPGTYRVRRRNNSNTERIVTVSAGEEVNVLYRY